MQKMKNYFLLLWWDYPFLVSGELPALLVPGYKFEKHHPDFVLRTKSVPPENRREKMQGLSTADCPVSISPCF